MKKTETLLHQCLYFTVNSLARTLSALADETFRPTGLSPSHAFVLMMVNESPGIGTKLLAEKMNLAPSTITRLVDYLESRGHVTRSLEGKNIHIFPSPSSTSLQSTIRESWINLHYRYSDSLGKTRGEELARQIDDANNTLKGQK